MWWVEAVNMGDEGGGGWDKGLGGKREWTTVELYSSS